MTKHMMPEAAKKKPHLRQLKLLEGSVMFVTTRGVLSPGCLFPCRSVGNINRIFKDLSLIIEEEGGERDAEIQNDYISNL